MMMSTDAYKRKKILILILHDDDENMIKQFAGKLDSQLATQYSICNKISQMLFSVELSRAALDHPVVLTTQQDNFITFAC